MPSWFRKSAEGTLSPFKRSPDGPVTIYMEKADMAMNERIQEIAWTSRSSTSVNQRLGPFLEYDRLRLTEATGLLCAGKVAISLNIVESYRNIYREYQFRIRGEHGVILNIPPEFEAEKAELQKLRNENWGRGGERRRIIEPVLYAALCASGKTQLRQEYR